ncbi:ABC transporter permease [Nakamurella lactea]|uniref:ABC transporter permease n=1 Tax=Nakamurella lactea TaxID=459515 RepID=UPI000408AB92|nr:ABC transporter permease [Nakamurella lactea]
MTTTDGGHRPAAQPPTEPTTRNAAASTSAGTSKWLAILSVRNIAAIYVWLLLILIFAIWKPDLFLTDITARRILNEYAITGIAALSVVLPLAAGVFDLSIGSTIGLAGIVAGWLLGNTGLSPAVVILLTLCAGLLVGLLNSLVVVKMGIDSFIGTLATGAIISAITLGISGDRILTERTSGSFATFATADLFGIQLPVFYLLALMLIIGFVLEQTVFGRRVYATGYNPDTTTLVGVSVARVRTTTLMFSGVVAALAGVALTARIESADPSNGPSYLIPAFSAAFLGATQFRRGRFNPWGTVVAVLMLGTGSIGLLLAGAPQWAPQVFQGVVLIAAVGLTVVQGRRQEKKT